MRSVVIASLVAALVACACGSDSGSGDIDSGVDDSKPVNGLSAGDAQKVCDATASYATSRISADVVKKSVCVGFAAIQPDGMPPTVDDCNASVSKCLSSSQSANGNTTIPPTCVTGTNITTCTATVGQVESCAAAIIDQAAGNIEALDCSLYGLPPAEASMRLQPKTDTPQACTALAQTCPALVTAMQSSSGR